MILDCGKWSKLGPITAKLLLFTWFRIKGETVNENYAEEWKGGEILKDYKSERVCICTEIK